MSLTLKLTVKLTAGSTLLHTLQAFAARNAQGRGAGLVRSSYGPLRPTKDLSTGLELLQLPDGFQYKSFSWTGDLMHSPPRWMTTCLISRKPQWHLDRMFQSWQQQPRLRDRCIR